MSSFHQKPKNRIWSLKIIALCLLFALLAWIVWWYFDYRIESLKSLTK